MCLGIGCDHVAIDRRDFLGAGIASAAGLAVSGGKVGQDKEPPTRVLHDSSIQHGAVSFKLGNKEIDGYLARSKTEGKYPAVIVVAGNLITEEYIPNTCAALAVAGYVGLAPNIFHPVPKDATPKEMNKALENRTDANYLADLRAGQHYLNTHPTVNCDRIGILGFCSGGRRALLFGVKYNETRAVVAFHPSAFTKTEEVIGLNAPVQFHHGKKDRVAPFKVSQELEKQLKSQGTVAEVFLYDECDHGFLAYTRHPEYNATAAQEAWRRSVAFLDKHLKGI